MDGTARARAAEEKLQELLHRGSSGSGSAPSSPAPGSTPSDRERLEALQAKTQVLVARYKEQQGELQKWKDVAEAAVERLRQQQQQQQQPQQPAASVTPPPSADVLAKLAAAERRARDAEALARQVQDLLAAAPGADAKPSSVIRFVDAVGEALRRLESTNSAAANRLEVQPPPQLQPAPRSASPLRNSSSQLPAATVMASPGKERELSAVLKRLDERERELGVLRGRADEMAAQLEEAHRAARGLLTPAEAADRMLPLRKRAEELAAQLERERATHNAAMEAQRAQHAANKLQLERQLSIGRNADDLEMELAQAHDANARLKTEMTAMRSRAEALARELLVASKWESAATVERERAASERERAEVERERALAERERADAAVAEARRAAERAARADVEREHAAAERERTQAAAGDGRRAAERLAHELSEARAANEAVRAEAKKSIERASRETQELRAESDAFRARAEAEQALLRSRLEAIMRRIQSTHVGPAIAAAAAAATSAAPAQAANGTVSGDSVSSTGSEEGSEEDDDADGSDDSGRARGDDGPQLMISPRGGHDASAAVVPAALALRLRQTTSGATGVAIHKQPVERDPSDEDSLETETPAPLQRASSVANVDEPPLPSRPMWMDRARTASEAAQQLAAERAAIERAAHAQPPPAIAVGEADDATTPRTRRRVLLSQTLRKGSSTLGRDSSDGAPPSPSLASPPLTHASSPSLTHAAPNTKDGAGKDGKKKKLGVDGLSNIIHALTPKPRRVADGQSQSPESKRRATLGGSASTGGLLDKVRNKTKSHKDDAPQPVAPLSSPTLSSISPAQSPTSSPRRRLTTVIPPTEAELDASRDVALALFDYSGEAEGDLSFRKGERIVLYATDDAGWWRGRNAAGAVGAFPANRVAVQRRAVSDATPATAEASDAMEAAMVSPRTAAHERPPDTDTPYDIERLVVRHCPELRVLEVQLYAAVNLTLGADSAVYISFNDGTQACATGLGRPQPDGSLLFGDEFRLVGGRARIAQREPLAARVITVSRNGREDTLGTLALPVQECVWDDATWMAMRWCPVLDAAQAVRGLVQVMLRRVTVRAPWYYVAPRCSAVLIGRLSPWSLRAATLRSMEQLPLNSLTVAQQHTAITWTPLQRECASGHNARVAQLVEQGCSFDVEWRTPNGAQLLHLLAAGGYAALCRLVLTLGARASETDAAGNTPLHYAAASGHWDALRLLLGRGAPADPLNSLNVSALHLALCSSGAESACPVDVLEALLDAGADPAARSNHGATPLHCAALFRGGHPDGIATARLLLSRGCPPTARDDDGCSPYLTWLMCWWGATPGGGESEALAWLRVLGEVDASLACDDGAPELEEERAHRMAQLLAPDQRGDTALWRYLAARPLARNVADPTFNELVAKLQINRRYGLYGNTLLLRVVQSVDPPSLATQYGSLLLDAHPQLDASLANTRGMGLLHALAARGDDALVPLARRLCEDHRLDPNTVDAHGRTALHYTSTVGMLRLLLAHNARPEAVDMQGNTTLHTMYAFGDHDAIDLLLSTIAQRPGGAALLGRRNAEGHPPQAMAFHRFKVFRRVCVAAAFLSRLRWQCITAAHYPGDVYAKKSSGLYTGLPPTHPFVKTTTIAWLNEA